jgi:hypothetical protein
VVSGRDAVAFAAPHWPCVITEDVRALPLYRRSRWATDTSSEQASVITSCAPLRHARPMTFSLHPTSTAEHWDAENAPPRFTTVISGLADRSCRGRLVP